jgi:hypothetical protein
MRNTAKICPLVAIGLLQFTANGCGLVGPSCLSRQKTGAVTTVSGEVAPRQIVVHRVPYGTEGSQNDVKISWTGQFTANGPQIRVYATKVECVDFMPPADPSNAPFDSGPCGNIGSFGGVLSATARPCAINNTCRIESGDLVQTSLTIANGRGNPDKLGTPAEYKLWVVGDAGQSASYTISTTWFYGPDC